MDRLNRPEEKVLQVMGTLFVGGAETMMVNVFREIDRQELSFDFLVNGNRGGYYEDVVRELGGQVLYLSKKSRHPFRHAREFYRLLRSDSYVAVHFHTQNAFLTAVQMTVARAAGARRIIVHSHNTQDWRGSALRFFHRWFRGYLYRHADVRAACGKEAARWLFGTEAGVEIVPLPVPCRRFLYSEERYHALRKEAGVEAKTVYVHVGGFREAKNHWFLLEVFQCILKEEPESVLFLVGTGELQEAVRERAARLGIADSVVFCGMVTDVENKLILADVFLFPSKYEGLPTAVLEAQAAGLPCYVSDRVTREVQVTDLVCPISLERPPAQWAEQILEEKDRKRSPRSRYAPIVARTYDVSVTAAQLLRLYLSER